MPLPTIEGMRVREVLMHCQRGSSDKDYQIIVAMNNAGLFKVYSQHGPHGRMNQGGEKTPGWVSELSAWHMVDDLISEKRRRGYDIVSDNRDGFSLAKSSAPSVTPAPAAPTPVRQKAALPPPLAAVMRARVI